MIIIENPLNIWEKLKALSEYTTTYKDYVENH